MRQQRNFWDIIFSDVTVTSVLTEVEEARIGSRSGVTVS